MIILKSFFRKKTTKIYILILCLIASILGFLVFFQNYYIILGNKQYQGSAIFLTLSEKDRKEVSKIYNIKSIKPASKISHEGQSYYLLETRESILDKTVILPNYIEAHDTFTFHCENVPYTYKIHSFYESQFPIIYTNKSSFQNITKKSTTYRIDLRNWTSYKKTIDKIEKKLHLTAEEYINNLAEKNFEDILIVLKSFIIITILLFSFLLLITFINIIEDESKTNKIYISFGYSKRKIKQNVLLKLFLLILIFTLSGIFTYLIFFFTNIKK